MLIRLCPKQPIQAIRTCLRFRRQEFKIIEKVTQEYENTPLEAIKSSGNETLGEKKKRMIRYVFYDPTMMQKLAIMKARFFATGWIWVATAATTYIAVNTVYYLNTHFEKGRYCI